MSKKTDYYQVLGLQKTATDSEIKNAYRNLAKEWHPDKNKDPNATKKFGEISEAYGVLKDEQKRKTYDNFGFAGIDGGDAGFENGGMPSGFDPMSMFKQFFQKENDIPEIQVPIKATLEELYTGVKKKVKYERFTLCKECKSTGCVGDNVKCAPCKGNGVTIVRTPMGMMQTTCRTCGGKGNDPKAPKCVPCKGAGCFKEEHTLTINIPKGCSEKHPIMLENEGNEIPENERNDNNNRSNVIAIISESTHQKYKRGTVIKEIGKINENNLFIEIKLTLEESLCGFEKTFTHLDGKLFTFGTNNLVRNGDVFVMKGHGMPYYNENKKGDLLIKICVENKTIPAEKKSKLWKLLSTEPYVEIKPQTQNIVNYNDYKVEMVNEHKKESMKNKYRYQEDDDDIDDNGRGHPMGPMGNMGNMAGQAVQCAQQ